jgi:Nif-specific regulatory protein
MPSDEVNEETKKLSTLLELNKTLTGSLNLKHSLHRVLEILEQRHGMFRSTVMLLRGDSELYIEASNGITAEGQRAHYSMGEGSTARRRKRKSIVIPQAREPLLLNQPPEKGPRRS